MAKNEEGTGPAIRLLRTVTATLPNPFGEGTNGELPIDVSLQLSHSRVNELNISVALSQDGRTPSKSLLLQMTKKLCKTDALNVVDANMLFRGPANALFSSLT